MFCSVYQAIHNVVVLPLETSYDGFIFLECIACMNDKTQSFNTTFFSFNLVLYEKSFKADGAKATDIYIYIYIYIYRERERERERFSLKGKSNGHRQECPSLPGEWSHSEQNVRIAGLIRIIC